MSSRRIRKAGTTTFACPTPPTSTSPASRTTLPARATKSSSTPSPPRPPLSPPPSEQSFRTQGSKTQDLKTQDLKTPDSKTEDSKTQASKTQDLKTQDLKTQDSKTRDLKTQNSRTQKSGKQKQRKQKSRIGLKAITKQVEKRRIGRGFFATPWLRFKLSRTDYERFEQQYQEDGFVQDKLRYDYFPSASLFVLRMPGEVHEEVAASIVREIIRQLDAIASQGGPAAEFAKKIRPCASSTVRFDDPLFGKHDPDASFRHWKAKYPGVVIEVSHSQKKRDLPRLADDYILGSNSRIRAVVGIDVNYRGGKMATVSIWRPRVETNTAGENELVAYQALSDQAFRSEDGNQIDDPQAGLRLRLDDFAAKALAGGISLDEEIFIPAKDLFTYVCEGEDGAQITRASPCPEDEVIEGFEPGTRKRRRERTPPEELHEDDEKRFQSEEDKAEERGARSDSSYDDQCEPQPRRKLPRR